MYARSRKGLWSSGISRMSLGCVIKRDKYFLLLMALSKKSDLIWNKLF